MTAVARPPLQDRSRKTLAALVAAVEALLEERAFDDISIQDICARAGCTTGSFYGRFRSKEDLLPYLYETYDADLMTRMDAIEARLNLAGLPLEQAVRAFAESCLASYAHRPHLLREITLFARRHPEAISAEIRARREMMHARQAAGLAEKSGLSPGDAAFVLFSVATIAREMVLFSQAPFAQATPMSREALADRLARLALAFIRSGET